MLQFAIGLITGIAIGISASIICIVIIDDQ